MADGKDLYRVGLTMVAGVGDMLARRLLEFFGGDAEAVFREKERALEMVAGVGQAVAAALHDPEALRKAEAELRFVERNGIRILFLNEEGYPPRLAQCPDAPTLLYYKGEADLNAAHLASIVGTRSATAYGQELTGRFVHGLGELFPDTVVVSGLAYGIDIMAHRAALENKLPTVAVLAHGLDRIYPNVHRQTAVEMLRHGGGLLTEYPHETRPDKPNFVKRNRIVAGLSEAVVVVESPQRGGSLITADMSFHYGRSVYAFPGRTTDSHSQGCNMLIRSMRAALILSAEDFVRDMGWDSPAGVSTLPASAEQTLPFAADEKANGILTLIRQNEGIHINQLVALAGMPVHQLLPILVQLELDHLVIALPGGKYRAVET